MYLPEPPGGLHTGGTIINALSYLSDEPFLAINADIFTHYDFSKISCPKNSSAHLVLIKTPPSHTLSDFSLTPTQQLNNLKADTIFSGIACYHPSLFKQKPRGRSSLIPWLKEAADKGIATGEIYTGLWFDTGSPERLEKAQKAANTVR